MHPNVGPYSVAALKDKVSPQFRRARWPSVAGPDDDAVDCNQTSRFKLQDQAAGRVGEYNRFRAILAHHRNRLNDLVQRDALVKMAPSTLEHNRLAARGPK